MMPSEEAIRLWAQYVILRAEEETGMAAARKALHHGRKAEAAQLEISLRELFEERCRIRRQIKAL